MPTISIIVPVYKVEAYLPSCVESLLTQSFSDIEIILIDDGSPDNCGAICDIYAKRDTRVRVIHQENAGLSCARNSGIDAARGKYLCFVDSDDIVSPEYCQVLFNLLDGTSYDFSVCGTCRFDDGAQPIPDGTGNTFILSNIEFFQKQLSRKSEFGVWNKLYRKELFSKIRFAPKRLHEDVIWSGDLLQNLNCGVIATDAQHYYYRQRNGGIVSTQSQKCSADRVFAGAYLVEAASSVCPELLRDCLCYAVEYPWMFVDRIYVHRAFKTNELFLNALQAFLRKYIAKYWDLALFTEIQRNRMSCFAKSRFLYGVNAYARLARVYLYRILGKDTYRDGHGI